MLDLRNASSLTAVETAAVRRALEAKLQARGIRLSAGAAASAEVRVTLSENLEGFLWVAEIRHGEATTVAMVTLVRSAAALSGPVAPALVLRKDLVWEQEQPILDLALFGDASSSEQRMVVLEPGQLSLYGLRDARWALLKVFPIASTKPWPRDLRGQLHIDGTGTRSSEGEAILPGMLCTLTLPQDFTRSTLDCERHEPTNWLVFAGAQPVGAKWVLVAFRNFLNLELDGANGPVLRPAPLFSAAALPGEDSSLTMILAMVDGHIGLFASDEKDLVSFRGWGSDVTTIKTGCGSGWQVLATRPGDWTQPDAIRAYEIQERVAVGVTAPVELSGPVTALGPLAEGATLAVVHNLKTRRYEAYKLSISCSH